jgi:hypothetical protein
MVEKARHLFDSLLFEQRFVEFLWLMDQSMGGESHVIQREFLKRQELNEDFNRLRPIIEFAFEDFMEVTVVQMDHFQRRNHGDELFLTDGVVDNARSSDHTDFGHTSFIAAWAADFVGSPGNDRIAGPFLVPAVWLGVLEGFDFEPVQTIWKDAQKFFIGHSIASGFGFGIATKDFTGLGIGTDMNGRVRDWVLKNPANTAVAVLEDHVPTVRAVFLLTTA